ncbi:MAG TPA: hypothetical protein VKA94_15345 [Hyphomicrobiales bacterium]|nr:hypothetical protein [Hyphomicrobiales bacterium]
MSDSLWVPMVLLPNIELETSIECTPAAFLPPFDPRIVEIKERYQKFNDFLSRFSDQFGGEKNPTILAISPNTPQTFTTLDAIASLRDMLTASVIPFNRAMMIKYPNVPRTIFSRNFDFYPWMISKDYKYIINITPAIMHLHDVKDFRGQPASEIPINKLSHSEVDKVLFASLHTHWRYHFGSSRQQWRNRALMRSLNMAHHASQLPALNDTRYLDYGRIIALWVSAFEILVHPGGTDRANKFKVWALLNKVQWASKALSARRYKCRKNPTKFTRETQACWLYDQLYAARNDFLHGNPVTSRRMILAGSKRNMEDFAAPLYRLALTSFLNLRLDRELPDMQDSEAYAKAIADSFDFYRYQRAAEGAVLKSRTKD